MQLCYLLHETCNITENCTNHATLIQDKNDYDGKGKILME